MKMKTIPAFLERLWDLLREVCGENDYARCRARALGCGEEPPTPEAFYLAKLQRKYSRVSRCC
jgi:hypothetical protein